MRSRSRRSSQNERRRACETLPGKKSIKNRLLTIPPERFKSNAVDEVHFLRALNHHASSERGGGAALERAPRGGQVGIEHLTGGRAFEG
jgi:hypothetical protein